MTHSDEENTLTYSQKVVGRFLDVLEKGLSHDYDFVVHAPNDGSFYLQVVRKGVWYDTDEKISKVPLTENMTDEEILQTARKAANKEDIT